MAFSMKIYLIKKYTYITPFKFFGTVDKIGNGTKNMSLNYPATKVKNDKVKVKEDNKSTVS